MKTMIRESVVYLTESPDSTGVEKWSVASVTIHMEFRYSNNPE